MGEPQVTADVTREEVARAAGADHADLARAADRGRAMEVMGRGAGVVLGRLHDEGQLQAAAAVGGSGNSAVAAAGVGRPPGGGPKLIGSEGASRATKASVGAGGGAVMEPVGGTAGGNPSSPR